MKLISTWERAYIGSSSCGSGLCLESRARVCELKVAGTPASTLPCSAPSCHMAVLACTEQQDGSGRKPEAAWPVHAAASIVLHPPQMNGRGPDGSMLWDRAGSLAWEDHSRVLHLFLFEKSVMLCNKDYVYLIVKINLNIARHDLLSATLICGEKVGTDLFYWLSSLKRDKIIL